MDRRRPDDGRRAGGRRRLASGTDQPAGRVAPGPPPTTPGRRRRDGPDLSEACGWRDLTEPWEWTEDLAARPALASHPHEAAVHGAAANVAYMRGDFTRWPTGSPGPASTGRPTPRGVALPRAPWHWPNSAGGAHAEVIEHARRRGDVRGPPSENLGVAALAAAYAGQLAQARELNDRWWLPPSRRPCARSPRTSPARSTAWPERGTPPNSITPTPSTWHVVRRDVPRRDRLRRAAHHPR